MPRVTFIACLLAVTGCGSEDKPKPPPPPIDGIEIVQPGAAPRTQLRYKLAPPTETALELAMDLDATLADLDAKLPTLVMAVDVTAVAVEPDGTARMKMTVASARAISRSEADKPAMPVMERQARLLGGTVVTYAITPAGQVRDMKLEEAARDLSEPMQEQTRTLLQASEQLAMALPEKPVGVGAVWKHRRTIKLNQLTVVTVTSTEITALDGDQVTFKSTTAMTGPDQQLAEGSASVKVTRIAGTGTQTGTFDLTRAIVLGEAKVSLGFEIVGETPRATKMDLTWRFAPRTP